MIHSPTTAGLWLRPEVGPALEAVAAAIQDAAVQEDAISSLGQVLAAQSATLRDLSGILEVAGIRAGAVVLQLASEVAALGVQEGVSVDLDRITDLVEQVLWSVFHTGNLLECLAHGALDDPEQSLPVIEGLSSRLSRSPLASWELFGIPTPRLPVDVVVPPGSLRFGLGAEMAWVLPRIVVGSSEMPSITAFIPGMATELSRMTHIARAASLAQYPVPSDLAEQTLSDLRRVLFGLSDALRAADDHRPDAINLPVFSDWPPSLREVVMAFGLEQVLPRAEEREFSSKILAGLNSSVVLATTRATSTFIMEVADRIQLNQAVTPDEANVILAALDFVGVDSADISLSLQGSPTPTAARQLGDLSRTLDVLALNYLTLRSLPPAVEASRPHTESILVDLGGIKTEIQMAVEAAGDLESVPSSLGKEWAHHFDRLAHQLMDCGLGMMAPYSTQLSSWMAVLAASPSIQLSELRPWAQALGEMEYAIEALRDGARACANVLLATRETLMSAGYDPEPGAPLEVSLALIKPSVSRPSLTERQADVLPPVYSKNQDEISSDISHDEAREHAHVSDNPSWTIQSMDPPSVQAEDTVQEPALVFEMDAIREKIASAAHEEIALAEKKQDSWAIEELPLPDLDFEQFQAPEIEPDIETVPPLPAHIHSLIAAEVPPPAGPASLREDEATRQPPMAPLNHIPAMELSDDGFEVQSSGFVHAEDVYGKEGGGAEIGQDLQHLSLALIVPFDAPTSVHIDADMQEVFGEEINEEIASLAEWIPDLFQVPPNPDIIYNIRKSFHTIKGSGRMVGAATLGEMAWSVESVLNRVMEKRLPLSESVIALVLHANSMVVQFQRSLSGQPACWDTRTLIDWANDLLRGVEAPAPFPSSIDWSALAVDLVESTPSSLQLATPEEAAVSTEHSPVVLQEFTTDSVTTQADFSAEVFDEVLPSSELSGSEEMAAVITEFPEVALPDVDVRAGVVEDMQWDRPSPSERVDSTAAALESHIAEDEAETYALPVSSWGLAEAIPEVSTQPPAPPSILASELSLIPLEETESLEPLPALAPARGFGSNVPVPVVKQEKVPELPPSVPDFVAPTPAVSVPSERVIRPLSQDVILQGTDWKVLLANAQDQAIAARSALESGDVERALVCIDRQVPALDRLTELVLVLERASKLASRINRENAAPPAVVSTPSVAVATPPEIVSPPASSPLPPRPPRKEPVAVIPEPQVSFWRRWFWFGSSKKK